MKPPSARIEFNSWDNTKVHALTTPAALEGLNDPQCQGRHAPVTGLVEAQVNLAVGPQLAHVTLERLADGHRGRYALVVK